MSQTWQDSDGRDWTFQLNVFTAQRCLEDTGINLTTILKRSKNPLGPIVELTEDAFKFYQVCCSLLQEQMRQHGVDEEAMARLLFGDTIEAAGMALIRETTFFLPNRKGSLLREVMANGEKADQMMLELAEKEVAEKLSPKGCLELALSSQASAE